MTVTSKRASGILLHVTSLPSAFGIGDLGPECYKFIDLLASLKQQYWSILPINPTSLKEGNSPYKTESTFAGNPLLISPQMLADEGLVSEEQMQAARFHPVNKINFKAVHKAKEELLEKAFQAFQNSEMEGLASEPGFDSFQSERASWLNDYALYEALKKKSGKPWYQWPEPLRKRKNTAISEKTRSLKEDIDREKFIQYIFFSQWGALRDYCVKKGVKIFGDLSFYVSFESADVWSHPDLFKLNDRLMPKYVAGVPPDYFSKTGQLWGTPVYDWRQMSKTQFEWLMNRLKHNLKLCDVLRFDHFRGFIAYWQVPNGAKTAKVGHWIRAPAQAFFKRLLGEFQTLPFVAEDLGYITESVKKAITGLGLPGMRVLLFAFDGSKNNPHLPENHVENSVVYTGTHDTNTVKGWFKQEANFEIKKRIFQRVGRKVSDAEISIEFVKMALASRANLCVIPLQDALGLGAETRMNFPARSSGNWEWRVTAKQLAQTDLVKLEEETKNSGRSL